MKQIAILGSTGSIGTQTLDVVRNNRDIRVAAMAAGSNITLLERQVLEFKPDLVSVWEEEKAKDLAVRLAHLPVKVVWGMEGLIACAVVKGADIVVAAVVGMIGIRPVMEAIRAGRDIALANKETLVTAGHLILPLAKKHKAALLPVDSEHSAIFQCLERQKEQQVSRIILTASGGPFRGRKKAELFDIQVEDALKHPNWEMGRKITIDSSTMVNKGLEVIEAHWLFGVSYDKIEVIVQPQSVIHSMVEFCDGAVMAQLGTPDMKLPIQYALSYPERRFLPGERLDFTKLGQIVFEKPDMETFYGLSLAYEAGRLGGSMPAVYNAANEKAVEKFLNREIRYPDITDLIAYAMEEHKLIKEPSLEEILSTEAKVYELIDNRAVKGKLKNGKARDLE